MTDAQRSQITDMRTQGFGYTAIANTVGLSKGSVKAFCRSHGLSGVRSDNNAAVDANAEFCASCGKPLVQTPGKKKRRFCCDECRVKWWNSHPEQVKKKALYRFVCPVCGREFTAYGNARAGSTAPTTATSGRDSRTVANVSDETFEAELLYESSLSIAKSLLSRGLLTEEEYRVIDTKLLERYHPVIGTLFSENDLINQR